MNNANYRISLDIHDTASQVTLSARKGETGRTIYASLTERGRPYEITEGCQAEFVCVRPNGRKLKNECVIEGNVIRYDLTMATVSTAGIAECEFRLMDASGALLTSPRFWLEVWATIYTEGDAVDSEIANMGVIKSANPGYSEVFMWSDGNPNNENRVGYFVGEDMARSASMVKICDSQSNIRGVSMAAPGFASNAPGSRYDENSALRPQYCYVGLLGFAPVIDHGACAVNGRCRAGDDGTAVPDTSGGGYLVVERLDEERVLILMEPAGDILVRVENMVQNMQTQSVYCFKVIIGTTWSGTKAPYTQTISVPGMLSTDEPTIAMAASEDIDTAQREWAAFESVYCITTGNGNIKVYSMSKTTTPFKIQMLVVRQGAPGSGGYAAVLYPGTTGDVIAEVDGKAYAIDNAELGQQPSQEHMYSFEIL